ncbi:MAG: hypothetical protein LBG83_07830 [Oscillospiraceae bacterium]|nr:hypothetical protein [Oscillospiraceae bacterium]
MPDEITDDFGGTCFLLKGAEWAEKVVRKANTAFWLDFLLAPQRRSGAATALIVRVPKAQSQEVFTN